MAINYFGTVYATRAFLPFMVEDSNEGTKSRSTIVLTSSAAGQVGVFGYTAYSPTKYALRGFAEALQMEVQRDNIYVQVAYPPDTDTPGYQLEQDGKPEETHLISQAAGLFSAER